MFACLRHGNDEEGWIGSSRTGLDKGIYDWCSRNHTAQLSQLTVLTLPPRTPLPTYPTTLPPLPPLHHSSSLTHPLPEKSTHHPHPHPHTPPQTNQPPQQLHHRYLGHW